MRRNVRKFGIGRLILFTLLACIVCSILAYGTDVLVDVNTPPPTWTSRTIPALTANPASSDTPRPTNLPTSTGTVSGILAALQAECVPTDTEVSHATVIGITDGDTIAVQFDDGTSKDLRYIGMDTPERGNPFWEPAAGVNSELVAGKVVTLVKDVSETDRYGRLLRYVFAEDVFVNYELVRQGLALAGTWPPDTACDQVFKAAEEAAKSEAIGIWASQPTVGAPTGTTGAGNPTGTITIIFIFSNGVKGDHEPDEYVEIRNDSQGAINLQGWTLMDNAEHTYQFPEYVIQPGEACRIYTNEVHEETCGFSYGFSSSAIWNNGGDCAFIRDSSAALVDDFCY